MTEFELLMTGSGNTFGNQRLPYSQGFMAGPELGGNGIVMLMAPNYFGNHLFSFFRETRADCGFTGSMAGDDNDQLIFSGLWGDLWGRIA